MTIIYKITNPVGKVFIGKTNSTLKYKKRILSYYKKNSTSKLFKSFEMFGFDNHQFEELLIVENEEIAFNKHKEYVEKYDSFNNGLNNFTASKKHLKCKDITKEAISKANKGNLCSEKTKQKLHLINIKKRRNIPTNKKIIEIINEYKTTTKSFNAICKQYDITRLQLTEIFKKNNLVRFKKEKPKGYGNKGKSVLNVKTNKVYPSVTAAAIESGYHVTNLQSRLSGRLKNTTDFKYVDETNIKYTKPIYSPKKKKSA